jgi:hypothetical protein
MIDTCAFIDSDIALTAPRGQRGDYKLAYYLVPWTRTEQRTARGRNGTYRYSVQVTTMVTKGGPRDPVVPWDNASVFYCYPLHGCSKRSLSLNRSILRMMFLHPAERSR